MSVQITDEMLLKAADAIGKLCDVNVSGMTRGEINIMSAIAVIEATAPMIRAQALEDAANVAHGLWPAFESGEDDISRGLKLGSRAAAAGILALKEQKP